MDICWSWLQVFQRVSMACVKQFCSSGLRKTTTPLQSESCWGFQARQRRIGRISPGHVSSNFCVFQIALAGWNWIDHVSSQMHWRTWVLPLLCNFLQFFGDHSLYQLNNHLRVIIIMRKPAVIMAWSNDPLSYSVSESWWLPILLIRSMVPKCRMPFLMRITPGCFGKFLHSQLVEVCYSFQCLVLLLYFCISKRVWDRSWTRKEKYSDFPWCTWARLCSVAACSRRLASVTAYSLAFFC